MPIDSEPLDSPLRGASLLRANLPRRVRRTLEQLFSLVCDEYASDLERLLDELEQELLHLAKEPSAALHSSHPDNLDRLRQHRADLVPHFLVGLETALAQIREPQPDLGAHRVMLPGVSGSLRLVDENEIDEDAALRTICVRYEARGSLPLLLLGQRFGVLAGAPAFDVERLPVGPHGLCRVLAASARSLHVSLDARMLLYRLFDRHLSTGYMSLLEAMNLLLIREGVLPGLSYVPLRTRRRTAADGSHEHPTATTGAALPARRSGRADEQSGSASTAPISAFTGWPGVAGQGPAGGEDPEMFRLLQELLIQRRSLMDKLRARSSPPSADTMHTSEVVEALARLQLQPGISRTAHDVADIRQALLAQNRQRRGEAAVLTREDSDTFELLGLLYASIHRELREETPSKALLERLQLPLLRLALQDRGFFVRSQHPARQLLNAVAESGARSASEEEPDPQLQQHLHSVVEHVVEHYDGDAVVFEAASQSLQQHLQKIAHRAEVTERRHVEAARGKEKLELARRHALEVIETAVRNKHVPRFLQTLLLQAWADVLALVRLRHGESSEQWRRHDLATRQIVEGVLRREPPPAELIQLIQEGLGLVGHQGEEAAAIARLLTSAEESVETEEDPVSRTELVMRLKARARLGPQSEPAQPALAPRTPQEQARYQQLRSLPFGTWIEFVTNQQGDVVRRRLAWFSLVTDRALFVNQRGQRIDEQSLDHMARLIASNQARIVTSDRGRLVDRAWAATLGALRQLGNRNAPAEDPS